MPLLVPAATTVLAQDSPPASGPSAAIAEIDPGALEILEQARSLAFGASSAEARYRAIRIAGTATMPVQINAPEAAMKINAREATMVLVADRTGRTATTMNLPSIVFPDGRPRSMVIRSGFDGKHGWQLVELNGSMQDARLLSETELGNLRANSEIFFDRGDWTTVASRISNAGTVNIRLDKDPTGPTSQRYERSCHKIILTMRDGSETINFYDVETGLQLKQISDGVTVQYGDFRDVRGMVWPFRISTQADGILTSFRFSEFMLDPDVSDDQFAVPQVIIDIEKEKRRLEALLQSPEVIAKLRPFTTPGRWQPLAAKTDPDAPVRPMSLARLRGSGALTKGHGLQKLFQVVTPRTQGQGNRIRPLDDMRPKLTNLPKSFNRLTGEQRHQLEELQELLIMLGPTMVELEMLDP